MIRCVCCNTPSSISAHGSFLPSPKMLLHLLHDRTGSEHSKLPGEATKHVAMTVSNTRFSEGERYPAIYHGLLLYEANYIRYI